MEKTASRNLIAFIRNYTDLLEKQLDATRMTMRETVEGVMKGIVQISDRTTQTKNEANTVLVSTYTEPTEDARQSMDALQEDVNRVIESASAVGQGEKPEGDELRDKLRRNAGLFSKHMEALGTLDDELQELLMTMMGMLSRDDVIAQRIEHVAQGLQAMQTSLTYILVDLETRCRESDVEKLADDLKRFTIRSYTMEEERKLFFSVFGDPKKKAS